MPRKNHRRIALWLFACCVMVSGMVVLGGLTRLTESGLSITEWKPITGILPPFSETEWNAELKKYKITPEYIKKNYDISLADFKRIYWMEFLHRLLGRLTGFVFLVPFLCFLFSGSFSPRFTLKLLGILALGGLQGVIGWYMVQSGLVDVPAVSQYRLALHLFMALLLFSLLFWLGLSCFHQAIRHSSSPRKRGKETSLALSIITLLFLQSVIGAFLAGLDGGLVYNTFPRMDGQWVPGGLFVMQPSWKNFFENVTLIQFLHRTVAVLLLALIAYFWLCAVKAQDKALRRAAHFQLLIAFLQFFLGVATLLGGVPIVLASLHQANALVLLAISLFINHRIHVMKKAGEEA